MRRRLKKREGNSEEKPLLVRSLARRQDLISFLSILSAVKTTTTAAAAAALIMILLLSAFAAFSRAATLFMQAGRQPTPCPVSSKEQFCFVVTLSKNDLF